MARKYMAHDFEFFSPQKQQEAFVKEMTMEDAMSLESPFTFTVWSDKEALLIGGVTPISGNRAFLYSFISKNMMSHFNGVTRLVREYLSNLPYGRIEAGVDVDFKQGHRWIKILGFELETPSAKNYNGDGRDASVYVKHGNI